MRKFKTFTILMAALICLSLIFAGCKNNEGSESQAPQATTSTSPAQTTSKPSASPTPTPEPTPTPKLVEAFSEDFSGDLSKWEVNYGGDWKIQDGKVVVSPGPDGPKIVAKDTNFSNFVMEADVAITALREGEPVQNAGFIFHVSNPGTGADKYNGYYFGFDLDKAIAGKAIDGRWFEFGTWPLHEPLELGQVVKIKLVVRNGEFDFYVDDMEYPVAEDVVDTEPDTDPYESGAIGLRIWQNGASFDNIKVYVEEAASE